MPLNYTSRDEMASVFSMAGLDMRLADDSPEGEVPNPTEETFLDDCGEQATDEINRYLATRYDPSRLNTNRWVRRIASWMACYHLSKRRGNPKQFVAEYEKALLDLVMIQEGKQPLFDENGNIVPSRDNLNPSMSNLIVDDRYRRRKIRVQPETSVGGTSGRQDIDHYPYVSGGYH